MSAREHTQGRAGRLRETTLGEIAQAVGGTVEGDGAAMIRGAMPIERAGPDDLTFLANPRYAKALATTRAGGIVVGEGVQADGHNLIRVTHPYLAFARALTLLVQPALPEPGIHAGAHVHPGATLGAGAAVMAGAYVGARCVLGPGTIVFPGAVLLEGVVCGADCHLYPGVVVREDCRLGDRVILNPNVSIGGDGYGFAQDGARHVKIPQIGTVEIGDDVEIGAGSTVDRAAMGATTIGRGTKIDNLVMVGHGCTIGEDVLIVAQSGMAGSATIGDRAILAARAGVLGHLTLGAGTLVYSRAHVTKSTPEGAVVSGNPARPHKEQLRRDALLARIDQLNERVAQLERRVGKQDEQK